MNSLTSSNTTPAPTCDARQAVDFLALIQPVGQWCLCAISHEGIGTAGARFATQQRAECEDWIAEQNARQRSVYYRAAAINPAVEPLNAKDTDVIGARFTWVDLDPRKDKDKNFIDRDGDRAAALRSLTTDLPIDVKPPTLIIDSGNGYQALWAFETPLRILDAATLDDFRQINRWLCSLKFKGGDKVFAPNHLLRLPYTVNWKRKTSGVYPVASVVSSGGPTYPLTCFGRFADAIDKPSQAAHPVTIDTANLKRLSSLDDLPPTVTPRLKALINCGNVPCELKPDDNSRSAWLFDAVCNLIRARVDDVTIFGIITDTRFGIAASVLDKSKPEEYARKQIEKAHAMAGNESRGIAESDGDFILHEGGKLLESIAKMESVLLNGQGRPIYQRGEFLVRPTTIGTVDHGEKVKGERHTTVDGDAVIRTGGIERVIGTPTIRRVSAGWIQREVASNSHWYKPGAKGNIPIDPPSSIAGHILEKVQYRPEPPSTKQSKFLLLRPASLSA